MKRELIFFCTAIISSVVAGITFDPRSSQNFESGIKPTSSFETIIDGSKTKGSPENTLGNPNITEDLKMVFLEPNINKTKLRGFFSYARLSPETLNSWIIGYSPLKKDFSDRLPFKPNPAREINDELLNHKIPECRSSVYKSNAILVEDQLSLLLSLLKVYVRGTTFDFRSFEKQGLWFEERLEAIYQPLNKLAPCNTDLLVMHAFANYILSSMISAIEKLRYYSIVDDPSHELLYSVININILILSLYDIRGDPDTSTIKFSEKISSYRDYLNDWQREFEAMKHVPFGKQVVFRSELYIAQMVLQPLLGDKSG